MILGVIADDFTGASDIANTLAREGMATRLFIGEDGAMDGCDAGVIALKTRSIAAEEAVAQSLAALDRLRAAGCRQFIFKYCSTFDSTPAGNIGPVAEALAQALDAHGIVVCPAFPATGRTVYQGHLFVGDRLLSDSGMERHPLTPMTDPDVRRWLARQSAELPGHVPLDVVRQGAADLRQALAARPERLVVVDAITDDDLRTIGAAAASSPLLTGASGVALGLPAAFRAAGLIGAAASTFAPNQGPALLLSGSCSNATRAQVGRYRVDHPAFETDVDALLRGEPVLDRAIDFVDRYSTGAPLILSSAEPEAVAAMQRKHGAERVAHAVEHLFGRLAMWAAERGFGRIVVAGGETSGAVVSALGLTALDLGPEIDPGVPALSTRLANGAELALALKSGNFGAPDFLTKATRMLGGGHA